MTAESWPAGTEIDGRFTVKQMLTTTGASSFIYLCEDSRFGRQVVIKALRPDVARDQKHVERFLRESRVLSQLRSPNIIRTFDRGTHDGVHWHATEHFGRSEDLRLFIDKFVDASGSSGRVPIGVVHKLMVDLFRALYTIHPSAHRDIKPSNILIIRTSHLSTALSEDSEDYHLILLDFGIVKAEDHEPLTATGQICGSEGYRPPEAFDRGATVDHRGDLYAAAVVAAELLGGRRLSPGFRSADLLHCRPEVEVKPWIPLLDRQLSHNPDERADAREVLAYLETIRPTSSAGADPEDGTTQAARGSLGATLDGPSGPSTVPEAVPLDTEETAANFRGSDRCPSAKVTTAAPNQNRGWKAATAALAVSVVLALGYIVHTTRSPQSFVFSRVPAAAKATAVAQAPEQPAPVAPSPQPQEEQQANNTPKMKEYDVFGQTVKVPEGETLRIRIE